MDNEIFTIYNLAETETLVLELKPYLKRMKQDTRPYFKNDCSTVNLVREKKTDCGYY